MNASRFSSSVQTKPRQRRHKSTNLRPPVQARGKGQVEDQQQLLAVIGKIVIYSALSILGMVSVVELTRYSIVHQSKLQQLQSVIREAEQRTHHGNKDFQRSFGTHRAQELMQENSYKLAPGQQPIVIYNQENGKDR